MGSRKSWRRAYGAIKDSTKVGLAQINSDYAELDVAIVKATNHVECPPKERHVRKILLATSAVRPRADVAYCIHTISRRLVKTRNWTVALKSLIVVHRLLRDGDPTFREELLNFTQRGRFLQLSNFKDDSSPVAWDCSAWVRTYGLFLEERLECFRIIRYDIEAERLPKITPSQDKMFSKTRDLESDELLEQLPALQQFLFRLVGCKPEGAAASNYVIQYALALVLKESFKLYCAINDGIINLVDKFFEMPRHEAVKALDAYRRAIQQSSGLSDFYESCKGLELARNFQFPVLREPPQTFLSTMEEYIREAPRVVSVPNEPLLLTYRPEENPPEENIPPPLEPETTPADVAAPPPPASPVPPPQTTLFNDDLLGLSSATPDVTSIEENNAMALAIVPVAQETATVFNGNAFDPTGWELALVDAPSVNISTPDTTKHLAGGLDSLTLNSLYDEASYRNSHVSPYGVAAPNPFESQDPFAMSKGVAPPVGVQMGMTSQPPMNPFDAFPGGASYQQQQTGTNPFGESPFGQAYVAHHPTGNPFGTSGLI